MYMPQNVIGHLQNGLILQRYINFNYPIGSHMDQIVFRKAIGMDTIGWVHQPYKMN